MDREVPGLITAGSWAFFLFYLSYQKGVLNQVPHGGATLLIFLYNVKCLAVQLEAKQGQSHSLSKKKPFVVV